VTAAALALVLGGASAAYAAVHKTVTLDVDGQVSRLSTFAGSVEALLADEAVVVGDRDLVSATGPLAEGQTVVVRHGHEITVSRDGAEATVWTTALTAEEALDELAVRGGVVSLVVSRSAGRAELPLDLRLSGPVSVVVDGGTLSVQDADLTVAAALDELGVTLGPLDDVSVTPDGAGVQVVVRRVEVHQETTTFALPFATTEVADPSRYTGTRTVTTAGAEGQRVLVESVTTVDGAETARISVTDRVTAAPVDAVVAVGTKARPAAVPASSADADGLNWAALARCESGGRANAVSASGKYYGLYQFSLSTWQAVGGTGLPSEASADEQTARAKALYTRSGAGQWPHCGKNLFT
jgi:uncharacterized protein YabE (DUF348 family)